MINFLKTHQHKIVLSAGYVLVALLGFGLGKMNSYRHTAPDVKIEEAFTLPDNYSSISGSVQSAAVDNSPNSSPNSCEGKIKGNISSSSKIYHMPGGSFYERTTPEMCFNTEAQAQAAGFRRSTR